MTPQSRSGSAKRAWPIAELRAFDELTSFSSLGKAETGTDPLAPIDWTKLVSVQPIGLGRGLLGAPEIQGSFASEVSASSSQALAERLSALKTAVEGNPMYKRLMANPNVVGALNAFRDRRSAESRRSLIRPCDDYRLLNIIAHIVVGFHHNPNAVPGSATLPTREAALKAAKSLIVAMNAGVQLLDAHANRVLEGLLEILRDELASEVASGQRKARADGREAARMWIDHFIESMLITFGVVSAITATHVAALVEPVERSTAERRIAAVKAKRRARAAAKIDLNQLPLRRAPKLGD